MTMAKKQWIAVSCTTMEALTSCLREHCPVICVEDPLFSEQNGDLSNVDRISDYEVIPYDSKRFIMLIKFRGPFAFDKRKYSVYYFPLHGPRA